MHVHITYKIFVVSSRFGQRSKHQSTKKYDSLITILAWSVTDMSHSYQIDSDNKCLQDVGAPTLVINLCLLKHISYFRIFNKTIIKWRFISCQNII